MYTTIFKPTPLVNTKDLYRTHRADPLVKLMKENEKHGGGKNNRNNGLGNFGKNEITIVLRSAYRKRLLSKKSQGGGLLNVYVW